MAINIRGRHFLTLKDFSPLEIQYLLDLSQDLKSKRHLGNHDKLLVGKDIVLLFEKASTRTRCAFEIAAKEEGANVTYLSDSHLGKKESIADTAMVLGRYYDGIEFRGFKQETIELLAKHAGIPVWNGLTDEDHPTQVLADLFTIREQVAKPLNKVKLVYIGDARNNMGNALLIGAAKMGLHFVAAAPASLFPNANLIAEMQEIAKNTGAKLEFISDPQIAVKSADIIYTDVWASMGEEAKLAERIKLLQPYQVNQALLAATKNPDVKFMHCLPAFHDTNTEIGQQVFKQFGLTAMEVTDEVFQSTHSIVFDQAENRLHTIKAILVATIGS